jgi:hypothetical protein
MTFPVDRHRAHFAPRHEMANECDLPMLRWTTAGRGARFALVVRHTNSAREWACDRRSPIGRLDKALDGAQAKGWTVVDMKNDWLECHLSIRDEVRAADVRRPNP